MLGVQLSALLDGAPPGVDAALGLADEFDDALVDGFARLGGERAGALTALAGALGATPLGPPAREAAEKIAAGSVTGEHLTALAGGRTALYGAVHDALLARFDAALGRDRAPWTEAAPAAAAGAVAAGTAGAVAAGATGTGGGAGTSKAAGADNLLAGCRSWLQELAIAGWRGVDHDLVSGSDQAVEALLKTPELRRLAVLLDGLAAELRAASPVATMEHLPARRWADLWARALMLSQPGGLPGDGTYESVSGRLLILGADVHEHATAVQVQVHAVLEPSGGGPPRLVRTSVAAAKVDTIVGPAVWGLLRHPVLLGALAERRGLDVTDLPLLAGGDLVWDDDRATPGEPADPFATARLLLAEATAPAVPPLDRHPVRIAEPVLVEGHAAGGEAFELDGHPLPVDLDRLPACGPLTPALVAAADACVGLVRWDAGRWSLQPLAVRGTLKRKPFEAHNTDWAQGPTDPKVVKAQAKAGDAVAVLRERAGRLLRQ